MLQDQGLSHVARGMFVSLVWVLRIGAGAPEIPVAADARSSSDLLVIQGICRDALSRCVRSHVMRRIHVFYEHYKIASYHAFLTPRLL